MDLFAAIDVETDASAQRGTPLRVDKTLVLVLAGADLASAWQTDILQGAWMGSAILRLPGADFRTPPEDPGWRGLVEWCLRSDAAVRAVIAGRGEHTMTFPDQGDVIVLRREGGDLVLTCTYSQDVGTRARGREHAPTTVHPLRRILLANSQAGSGFPPAAPAAPRNASGIDLDGRWLVSYGGTSAWDTVNSATEAPGRSSCADGRRRPPARRAPHPHADGLQRAGEGADGHSGGTGPAPTGGRSPSSREPEARCAGSRSPPCRSC